jgi:hypothetical protein
MILKDKLELNENDYLVCSKINSIGDYDFYHIKQEQSPYILILVGKTIFNLSEIPRTPIALSIRTGEELLQEDFFKENYNIESHLTYYTCGIYLPDYIKIFIFNTFEEASLLQYKILNFKSNNFFKLNEPPLRFEQSRFTKKNIEG